MSYFDNRTEYFANPVVVKNQVGDFTSFYITIAICSVFVGFLFILNIFFCCSRYSSYWLDHNTGNRWILPIWTKTAHKQPPLDCTELESNWLVQQHVEQYKQYQLEERQLEEQQRQLRQQSREEHRLHGFDEGQQFFELKKRESDL